MPLSHVQPASYDHLLAEKLAPLKPRFQALGAPEPAVVTSPREGFRLRAEFRMWHEGEDLNYVMFKSEDRKTPVIITEFPIASHPIQDLMGPLKDYLKSREVLRRKLFQIEFLGTLAGDMLVTLIYHRPLDDAWQVAAEALASEFDINVVGRSRKQKRLTGRDWVEEVLSVDGRAFRYKQPEQAFTQPNGVVNQAMIEWALGQAEQCAGDLLELYCGIGNFTLPLASAFNRVIATELSKPATAAADENRISNGIENIEFARLSAEDMAAALAGERRFRRLAHLSKPLGDYDLNTLLVDPPRAGLDDKTLALSKRFDNIIYISCNPETLLANLQELTSTHRIEAIAFFDQFPYTPHMETGVFLQRLTESTPRPTEEA